MSAEGRSRTGEVCPVHQRVHRPGAECGPDDGRPYVTPSGKVLTDADFEALTDEAEQGADEATWTPDDAS